jgi:isoleucyl-tRNA synthetase
MRISSLGRAARAKAGIKVRQPLAKAIVKVLSSKEREALTRLTAEIMGEINVKGIEFSGEEISQGLPGYSLAGDAQYQVAVNIGLTAELIGEGVSREIVRRLQNMRRSANFDIADHIVTYYQTEGQVKQVMVDFGDYIKQETLSLQLLDSPPPDDAYAEKYHVSGSEILLAIKLARNP